MVTPELCQGFSRAHPQVQVTHVEDHHEGLIERLYKGQIDVAVTYDLEVQGTDITFEPLATLPPHVIVGETSPLAQQRVADLKGLAEHPMVLLDLPRSREYFFDCFTPSSSNRWWPRARAARTWCVPWLPTAWAIRW